MPPGSTFVLDTMVLSHAAQARVLGTLETIFQGDVCLSVGAVYQELFSHQPSWNALSQRWLELRELTPETDNAVLSILESLGGEGDENLGEAECIVLAREQGGLLITDDNPGHAEARKMRVESYGSTDVIARGVQLGRIDTGEAAKYIDEIKALKNDRGEPVNRGIVFSSGEQFLKAYNL